MSLALLPSHVRLTLLIIGGILVTIAYALTRGEQNDESSAKHHAIVALATFGFIALGVIAGERVMMWSAGQAAPDTADFNEYRWVLLSPWSRTIIGLGITTAAVIAALSWRASRRIHSPWRRATAIGLRTGAAAAALVLFLEPALELRQVAREPNRIAVLVDTSASMTLAAAPDAPPRVALARALIERSADAFAAWRNEHFVDFYTFDSSLRPATEATVSTQNDRGKATLLREALDQARDRYDGVNLAGMVVLSDGTTTGHFSGGASDGASRDFLESLDTVVHTAWVSRPGLKDLAVNKILADEFAFVRTVVTIEVAIRSTGFDRRRIPVTLSQDGKPLRKTWVDVGPGITETTVSFEFTPANVGKFVYEVATPVDDAEAVTSNNNRAFVLRVLRDKIRVLQVAGAPSWDVRALRRMLKQNPNVDLISFFILRTHEDLQPATSSEMSLIPFPTHELFSQQLPSFDLIVLQNFNFSPYEIAAYLDNIRAFVEGGGGFVMLGGSLSFSSGLYAQTPVAKVLPVTLLPNAESELLDTRQFRPQLTEAGRAHPISALRYADADNLAAWAALPQLEGINLVGDIVDGATALAVHPKLKTRSGAPMPVISAGEYGDGRTLAVTTDSLWRWSFANAGTSPDTPRAFHKFWENAIRWTIQDPELRYLHVEADAAEYYQGTPVHVRVRLTGRDYAPAAGRDVTLQVEPVRINAGNSPNTRRAMKVEQRTVTVDDSGEARIKLPGVNAAGVYRVRATAEVGGQRVDAVDIFVVRAGSAEFEDPAPREDILTRVAVATGGTALGRIDALPTDLPFREPRVVRVDRRSDVELWSRPWLLISALLLLGLEWGLRQRSGYL